MSNATIVQQPQKEAFSGKFGGLIYPFQVQELATASLSFSHIHDVVSLEHGNVQLGNYTMWGTHLPLSKQVYILLLLNIILSVQNLILSLVVRYNSHCNSCITLSACILVVFQISDDDLVITMLLYYSVKKLVVELLSYSFHLINNSSSSRFLKLYIIYYYISVRLGEICFGKQSIISIELAC